MQTIEKLGASRPEAETYESNRNPRPPPASHAASRRLAVSLPSRFAALGHGPEPGRREPSSRPRHGSGERGPAACATASWPSAAWRCSSTSPPRAPAPALSWPPRALGADTTLVSSLSSSIEKGESLKDTGLTLRALGAEAIILRHNSSGAAWLLEEATRLPVLNAGDGMHEHPTQALLDLRTILAHLRPGIGNRHRRNPGRRHRHHRRRHPAQPRGPLQHAAAAPAGRARAALRPQGTAAGAGRPGRARASPIERDFEAALRQSQAVMMLRIQAERLAGLQLDLEEYKASYQLTGQRLAALAPSAVVLASRPHHSRPGDHRRRGRRPAVGDPRTGHAMASPSAWRWWSGR